MRIFEYDAVTGELKNPEGRVLRPVPGRGELPEPDTYPQDQKKYPVVPNCTTKVPPAKQEGHAVCFVDDDWDQVEDHRGEEYWLTEDRLDDEDNVVTSAKAKLTITELGPVPDDLTDLEPGPLDDWVTDAWVENVELKRQSLPSLTRRQLLIGLKTYDLITGEEAVAAAQTGAIPAGIQAIFDTLPTQAERDDAAITWASMSVAVRTDPLLAAVTAANELSEEDVDAFFETYSQV